MIDLLHFIYIEEEIFFYLCLPLEKLLIMNIGDKASEILGLNENGEEI